MKKDVRQYHVYRSISQMHEILGLSAPLNPLISLINYDDINEDIIQFPDKTITSFYKISLINHSEGKIKYGQNYYNFDNGGLCFAAPDQVISKASSGRRTGVMLLFHPDLLSGHPLSKKISKYSFFFYNVNESLQISVQEKQIFQSIFKQLELELSFSTDNFSQDLLLSNIELLLNYSARFYKRQIAIRRDTTDDLLSKMEVLLTNYFESGQAAKSGLPTVRYLSDQLNYSPDYLSDVLKLHSGHGAQQHIHNKMIEKAKKILRSGNFTVAEVGYQLGYEHPQSFTKIFKRKTKISPLAFKQSFE